MHAKLRYDHEPEENMMASPTRRRPALALGAALIALLNVPNSAQDWPQWRGTNRDGAIASFREPGAWPEKLKEAWKVEIGTGYASPLLIGDRLYVFSRLGDDEVMSALDAASGKVI